MCIAALFCCSVMGADAVGGESVEGGSASCRVHAEARIAICRAATEQESSPLKYHRERRILDPSSACAAAWDRIERHVTIADRSQRPNRDSRTVSLA
jgi:hypothetical protein